MLSEWRTHRSNRKSVLEVLSVSRRLCFGFLSSLMLKIMRPLISTLALLAGFCWASMHCWGQSDLASPGSYVNANTHKTTTLFLLSSAKYPWPPRFGGEESTSVDLSDTQESIIEGNSAPKTSVDWKGIRRDSLQFLVVMNGFRITTEKNTRAALHNPLFSGYIKAVTNMHGWDDGDEFYVNYIGHPMQGAVSSFIWNNRDGTFNKEHISWSAGYLKSKLRAGAFSFVLSELFELGPLSEASIGQIQRYHPANGFVDHVVTPTVGLIWSTGEDAIDDSLVRYIEEHTSNRVFKIFARTGLNPARSFANLMSRKYPWYRTNRPIPTSAGSSIYYSPVRQKPVLPPPGVAPFQFNFHFETRTYFGKNASEPCVGGGGEIAFRVASSWQVVGEVTGCKQTGMAPNVNGDTLTYAAGPQWTTRLSEGWATHARFLMGGTKVTQEQSFPELKKQLEAEYKNQDVFPPLGNEYTRTFDSNALAVVAGAGFDYKWNKALLFRVALDYSHSWNPNINEINYRNSLRLSSGVVLNMGTW